MVEDSIIEENLAQGSFAFIFKGTTLDTGTNVAFKLAKAEDLVERVPATPESPRHTNALSFFTGGTRNVRPDAEALLALQFKKIKKSMDTALVKVQKLKQEKGLCYYQMEFLPGGSMRELIEGRNAGLSLFASLALMLDRLSHNQNFGYHGDLKPENIMVGPAGLKLIDPGYFGPLQCQEGSMSKCAITTTCYYPTLTPDDLYAFGVMLWEACLGEHPLLGAGSENEVGDTLRQKIKRYSSLGYYGFEPLLRLRRPSVVRPNLSLEVEKFLLKALRLDVDAQGRLEEAPGFADFAQIHEAITRLQSAGLDF